MDYFKHKRVFITGGSSGIGLATAKLLAQQGADIAIVARHIPRLAKAKNEIKAACVHDDQQVIAMPIDVTNLLHIRKCAQKVMEQWGWMDLLINNAGISWPGYLHQIPDSVWENIIDINYIGTVNTTLAFLPYFMRQKSGHITNVASVLGFMGLFGYSAYSASKFAVVGFSDSLRQDLLPYHIHVSVFYPPDTDTPLLVEENKIKPAETKALAGKIKAMSAEKVARCLIKGIEKKKYTIIPGAMSKLTYYLNRFFPGILRFILDRELIGFQKQRKKQWQSKYRPEYG
ncbi:SDR family NAD(P)-dependent oxidoreductase [bacterium]